LKTQSRTPRCPYDRLQEGLCQRGRQSPPRATWCWCQTELSVSTPRLPDGGGVGDSLGALGCDAEFFESWSAPSPSIPKPIRGGGLLSLQPTATWPISILQEMVPSQAAPALCAVRSALGGGLFADRARRLDYLRLTGAMDCGGRVPSMSKTIACRGWADSALRVGNERSSGRGAGKCYMDMERVHPDPGGRDPRAL